MNLRALGQDIASPRLIIAKGCLFVVLGVLASAAVLAMSLAPAGPLADIAPPWLVMAPHLIAIWAFCRAYYFAFYVIGRYIDPTYKFAGLYSAVKWLLHHQRA